MLINAIHHFEILTKTNKNLLNYFINCLNFKLIAVNSTDKSIQHIIRSKNSNFVITSLSHEENLSSDIINNAKEYDTIENLGKVNSSLLRKILSKSDSVFNVALQVKSIDYILSNCTKNNVEVIKKKSKIQDSDGFIYYAIINSCVDGVVHTLIQKDGYKQGFFLPNIQLNRDFDNYHDPITTHFDHLTYATFKDTSNSIIQWYKDIFKMKKFFITNNKNEDLVVKTGDSGMKLKAINYWFCAESGICLENSSIKQDFKFIIAEPIDDNAENQIRVFLNENNGPGIQHIGLYTPNIINSVAMSKLSNNLVTYYVPPDGYYEDAEKQAECKKSGHNIRDLKENHILIDVENNDDNISHLNNSSSKYLLQVFTKPLFDKNTFFLEFIQRVNGAFGFGAGNIRALWNAVHLTLINKKN